MDRREKTIPGGVNSPVRAFEPYPFFASQASGSKLFGVDGESYIDYCMAYGALLFGHANQEVVDAVKAQLSKGSLYGVPTALEVEFSQLVTKAFPSIEMLRQVNSGTEATMHAIRTARGYTNRKKIIKFEGCFHGSHDGVLVKAGSGATTFGSPTSLGVPEETAQNTIVLPYNNITALEETIKREGNDIAAVIIEPVMGNVGLILPQNEFLGNLKKLTEDQGILLIFDEIITGFRLALGGAQQHFKIKADLTTLGKVIGGGFPLALFGGRKEIMNNISPSGKVYQAGTFSGNPISTTAGLTILKILYEKQNEIYPKLQKDCAELSKALLDFASHYSLDAQVYNLASMFQIFFNSNPVIDYATAKLSINQKFETYFKELLRNKVFIPPSQYETCFVSTAHNEEDLKITIEAFDKAMKAASNQK